MGLPPRQKTEAARSPYCGPDQRSTDHKPSSTALRRTTRMRRLIVTALLATLVAALTFAPVRAFDNNATARIIGEVFANGQQMHYLSLLSDEIGSRLTGSSGARRAEEVTEAEMKRIGLENVHREPFQMPVAWERGTAQAWL